MTAAASPAPERHFDLRGNRRRHARRRRDPAGPRRSDHLSVRFPRLSGVKPSIGLEPMTLSLPSGPGWFWRSGVVRKNAVKSLQSLMLCRLDMTRAYRTELGRKPGSGPTRTQ